MSGLKTIVNSNLSNFMSSVKSNPMGFVNNTLGNVGSTVSSAWNSASSAWNAMMERERQLNADPDIAAARASLAGVPVNSPSPEEQVEKAVAWLQQKLTADTKPNTSGHSASAVAADPAHGYAYADLAKQYGMSAETAYQEALSNTSYQRAVKDLQAAGLNPALAMGKVTGADSFAAASSGGGGATSGYAGRVDEKNSALSLALNGLGVICSAASIYTAVANPKAAVLVGGINAMSRTLTGIARTMK